MIKVTTAGIEDHAVILKLAKIIWPHTYKKILSGEQLDFMFEMMYSKQAYTEQISAQNHKFLLAEEEGNYVGFASYELNYQPNTAKIHKLYILPDTQGKGIGKTLVAKIGELALREDNTVISLNVNRYNPAVNFYLNNGFVKAGEEDINIGNGYLMEDFIMQKAL